MTGRWIEELGTWQGRQRRVRVATWCWPAIATLFFRPLKKIREGDEIDVTGPEGVSRYKVEFTQIVGPEATEVLRSTGGATLTLITCYPFRFVGNAPDRFIVRGQKVDKEASDENVSVSGSRSGAARRRL